ncbi:NTF2 fold immunity protein [Epilithonimonas sp.]|uniref:NTF2 fold immunity protein n=1 Tax=Epilithonimonas sp. TaxID=2894511 RepID=UPI0028AF9266|nr:NTF2 fold immunity protein [Epilithonimonas sp.]
MKNIITYFSVLFIISFSACSQTKDDRIILGKSYAQQELKSSLVDKKQHNLIDYKSIIIKDSATAINIAEPILFSIYGKNNITEQRPYETYLIDNYWIIKGTLPKYYMGGTFLIIINAFDSKIIKITHGK